MNNIPTVIRVRRGIEGGFRYCACTDNGDPIQGFSRLSDIRKYWKREIQMGYVVLVRELGKKPDMQRVEETIKCLEVILRSYAKK